MCKYVCSCDYSPVNLIIVIEGNQADVYPAQGKQGNQNDQCKPTTCTLWRQNTFVFKRLKLQADSIDFCNLCGKSACVCVFVSVWVI